MKYCKDCWGFDRCKAQGRTVDFPVDDGVCRHFDPIMPMTNADRIRAMTDEELAWELMSWRIETEAKHQGVESSYPNTQATILEWLQQPAEGEST